jgi:hypothetical protein
VARQYLDLTRDAFDRNGVIPPEVQALTATAFWQKVAVKEEADIDVAVRFKRADGEYYTEVGRLEPGTELLVNEEIGIGVVIACRNDIESDWRTLEKLYK